MSFKELDGASGGSFVHEQTVQREENPVGSMRSTDGETVKVEVINQDALAEANEPTNLNQPGRFNRGLKATVNSKAFYGALTIVGLLVAGAALVGGASLLAHHGAFSGHLDDLNKFTQIGQKISFGMAVGGAAALLATITGIALSLILRKYLNKQDEQKQDEGLDEGLGGAGDAGGSDGTGGPEGSGRSDPDHEEGSLIRTRTPKRPHSWDGRVGTSKPESGEKEEVGTSHAPDTNDQEEKFPPIGDAHAWGAAINGGKSARVDPSSGEEDIDSSDDEPADLTGSVIVTRKPAEDAEPAAAQTPPSTPPGKERVHQPGFDTWDEEFKAQQAAKAKTPEKPHPAAVVGTATPKRMQGAFSKMWGKVINK